MKPRSFQPIPGLWRFHILYLIVTTAMGWSLHPFQTSASFLLVAASCIVGLICSWQEWHMPSHVLALTIGLGTPPVLFLGMTWWQTGGMFLVLLLSIYYFRTHLF